ncbi:MAG: cell division protein ZapE [Pseudomonadales bacterium]
MSSAKPGPISRYQNDLKSEGFQADDAQRTAVNELQRLFDDLQRAGHFGAEQKVGLMAQAQRMLKGLGRAQSDLVTGVYLWGGVGRGKTYLMDAFFETLPTSRKLRVHFHRFMRRVHRELTELSGQKNPLEAVAERIAKEADIICFDEFFVSDITDAMLLGGLFELLFEEHSMVLVATSNIVPRDLYRDGLQRARFLPAIALLEQHTVVLNVDSGTDYRLRTLEQAELYHFPLGPEADTSLKQSFDSLAPEPGKANMELDIEGRLLNALFCADDVVWFSFAELCEGPRSQNDYIEIAREFHAVLLSDVPAMGPAQSDIARRFVNLVDEFYDRNVKLILSAEVAIDELYSGGSLAFEFQRTHSRLLEMQSHDYLAREHLA